MTDHPTPTPTSSGHAYITATGSFLPGEPVSNDQIEARLGLINGKPSRLRSRILRSNGITSRHYALDEQGNTTHLNEELAAQAIAAALRSSGRQPEELTMLAAGTTQGDLPVPGFASMVHGRLGGGPLETLSVGGVCGSGFGALRAAANAVALGDHELAAVVGSEQISRIMKASRFNPADSNNMDAEFLRWMLSDGAGSVLIEPQPREDGLSLRIDWTHVRSHAHEEDVCMYVGARTSDSVVAGQTWLDQPTISGADQTGSMNLRQDIRRLPGVVALGVNEYVRLLDAGMVNPQELDHVLCHYSSEFFRNDIFKLMTDLDVMIPEDRWFSNLTTKGNTGAASIFIMLDEAFKAGRFVEGERILLMVPESGRFSVAFAHLTVVRGSERAQASAYDGPTRVAASVAPPVALVPVQPTPARPEHLLARLTDVWASFELQLSQVPIVRRIEDGEATIDDYRALLLNLRQQVAEGARWITRAASNIGHDKIDLRAEFVRHAAEEQLDFQMLERDFCAVGGSLAEIQSANKNVGSVALSAFMFQQADQVDPLDLLGAMFIIEGLGANKALGWAALLQDQLQLRPSQVTFLHHHGQADDEHTAKLHEVLTSPYITTDVADAIVSTAKAVARLYALQLEEVVSATDTRS